MLHERPDERDSQVMILWGCPQCGFSAKVRGDLPVHCKCGLSSMPEGSPIPPGVARRGFNYIMAYFRWRGAGKPQRSDEHVEALRAVCRECEYFDGKICTHMECGCKVDGPSVFGDKLRWSTEKCPVGNWPETS